MIIFPSGFFAWRKAPFTSCFEAVHPLIVFDGHAVSCFVEETIHNDFAQLVETVVKSSTTWAMIQW